MREKVAIKLREGTKDGELVETRPDGKEHSYYPRSYGVSFVVTELRVSQAFNYRAEGDTGPSLMQYFVDGIAWLSDDYGLSVIGEPQNKTKKVELQFRADDRSNLLTKQQGDTEMGFGGAHGRAFLGFNRADWEIKSPDQWYLCVSMNSASLQPLIDAVLAGTVKQANLRVRLKKLYSDDPPYMPIDDSNLYLRPNAQDNTIDMPECADGFLEGLRLDYSTIDVRPPVKPEPEPEAPAEELSAHEPVVDPILPAMQQLDARIEALRGTVKWVGGLIVACLVIIALK